MKFEFGNKLSTPTHCDQVLLRVQGGQYYIGFGMCQPTFDDAKPPEVCDIHAFVNMSPVMVKKLRDLLNTSIVQYEAAFGEIRIEPVAKPVIGTGGGWQSGGGASN